jgi:hypothetical protein
VSGRLDSSLLRRGPGNHPTVAGEVAQALMRSSVSHWLSQKSWLETTIIFQIIEGMHSIKPEITNKKVLKNSKEKETVHKHSNINNL